MAIYLAPGVPYTSRLNLGPTYTGLAGTVRFRLLDNDALADDPVYGPSVASIIEDPTGSGSYLFRGTTPLVAGTYSPAWDDGVATTDLFYDDDLIVTVSTVPGPSTSNLYITVDELKAAREMTGYSYADGDIVRAIAAASRSIDASCRRRFYADADASSARYYTPDRPDRIRIDDIIAITSVESDNNGDGIYETTWTPGTDYISDPPNAALESQPWTQLIRTRRAAFGFPCSFQSIKVTGQFGWPSVPAAIAQATLILSARYLARSREATFGVLAVGGAAEGVAMRISRTDSDVYDLIGPYMNRIPIL